MSYQITVVCLGNICRSPMGEVVLRDRIQRANLAADFTVESAGTGAWHIGRDADPRTVQTLRDSGYEINHIAQQIKEVDFSKINLLLAMDSNNYAELAGMRGIEETELRMFREFDPELTGFMPPDEKLNVPDPYYGGIDEFTRVLQMIQHASDGIIEFLLSGKS